MHSDHCLTHKDTMGPYNET